MGKRCLSILMLLCLLALAAPALADVHVDETPPEDWQERDLLRITVFRTGEGDCMLLQAGGENMMVDGGPYKYREKLRDALADRNVTRMKYLFSTHPHDDHIEGLRMLMRYGMETGEFVSVFPQNYTYEYQQKAVHEAEKQGIPYRQVKFGDTLTLGNAVLTVYNWEEGITINAQSAMLRVEYGECSALLCADVIGDGQKYFLDVLDPDVLKADVLKAPHHGLTAVVKEFLTAVDPGFMLITNYSGGKTNTIAGQAKGRGIPAKFSGDGTVYLECDGTDWYIYQTLYAF